MSLLFGVCPVRARVDVSEANTPAGYGFDFVRLVRTGTPCAPAPGLDCRLRNAERLGGGFVAYGLDVVGKVHAYAL